MPGPRLTSTHFTGTFRVGRISSVDKDNHRVQVEFFEIDGFVSWDLQVLRGFAADYCLPAKDVPVLCLILDGRLGVGFVLGAIYTDNDAPPLSDAGQRSIAGDDIRLGAPDASDKVALAPKVKDQLQTLRNAITAGKNAVVAQDGGLAAFTALDTALTTANWPGEPAAEKVKAK